MIQAKYIFTIEIDEEGKRTIHCEMPPHDRETLKGLRALKLEIDNVYSFCLDMYNDCNRMLLERKKNEMGYIYSAETKNIYTTE